MQYALVPVVAPQTPLTPSIGRIVATQDGTEVTFDPPAAGIDHVTLDRGEVAEVEIFTGVSVTANHPVVVAEFLVGLGYSNRATNPSMVVAVPREQWQSEYPVLVPDSYSASWVAWSPDPTAWPSPSTAPTSRACRAPGGLDFFWMPVNPGQHELTAAAPFTAIVSGQGTAVSYAYPGGGNIRPLL